MRAFVGSSLDLHTNIPTQVAANKTLFVHIVKHLSEATEVQTALKLCLPFL